MQRNRGQHPVRRRLRELQYYYHTDYLGSSYITNLDEEVVQHIEYVAFDEVFIEERKNIWNTH
ncbi:hypothetical protein [Bacteroides cellulosilyticus]|uniref:hypothetical protein n=1 Tax=Bacteroides cellulosilyticus TaxID=246787 RepID=UPI0032ED33D9